MATCSPANETRWHPRAVLVGLCAVALAGCGAQPSARATRPQTDAALVASPQQTAPRSAVPWQHVGPGWTLAEDAAIPADPAKTASGSIILYLIDPLGGRYRLFSWPAKGPAPYGALTDWSGDTQRALVTSFPTGKRPRQLVEQLNLRTGKFTGFQLPSNSLAIGYTRPDGKQVLVQGNFSLATGRSTLIRYNFRGQQRKALWRAPGVGLAVYSPDGQDLVTDSYGGLVLLSNAGGVIRHLRSPALCGAVRWWNSSTILASCAAPESNASRMWLIPASGAKGTALTPLRSSRGPDLGDNNLYQLSSGTYLSALGRHCGNRILVRQEPHGKVKTYVVPGAPDATIVTATGRRLLLQEDPGCSSPFPATLAWYDPVSGRQTVVVPVSRKDIGVIAAVPYYQEGKL